MCPEWNKVRMRNGIQAVFLSTICYRSVRLLHPEPRLRVLMNELYGPYRIQPRASSCPGAAPRRFIYRQSALVQAGAEQSPSAVERKRRESFSLLFLRGYIRIVKSGPQYISSHKDPVEPLIGG